MTTTTTNTPKARGTRAAFEARQDREARQWVEGHRRAAADRIAAIVSVVPRPLREWRLRSGPFSGSTTA
jgi:hypothetical protein